MSKRGVGLLLILSVTIALGALYQDYRFDVMAAAERAAGRTLDFEFRDLGDSLAMLQGAQRTYVTANQNPDEWLSRITKLIGDAEAVIAHRQTMASDADATGLYGAAAVAMARVKKIDGQARTALDAGDRPRASELVTLDAAAAIQQVRESFGAAQARDQAAIDHNLARLATLRWAMNDVAMLFVLGIALYLGWTVTRGSAKGAPTTAQMLRDLPPPVKTGTAAALASVSTVAHAAHAAPAAHATPATGIRPANLPAAAELCVDLARVLDSSDVPALLDRAASVLDAKGIVLWAVDSDGARLHASICHGYSDKVVRKLRPLQIDADNVTSLAFRSLQPQAINGATASDAAAIAVPLLTSTGCVGVLAAELRHNRPPADLMPVARILGAQFSALIVAPEDVRRTAQG